MGTRAVILMKETRACCSRPLLFVSGRLAQKARELFRKSSFLLQPLKPLCQNPLLDLLRLGRRSLCRNPHHLLRYSSLSILLQHLKPLSRSSQLDLLHLGRRRPLLQFPCQPLLLHLLWWLLRQASLHIRRALAIPGGKKPPPPPPSRLLRSRHPPRCKRGKTIQK